MKSDIETVKEIFSSKEKFLENIRGVEFSFKCYVDDTKTKHLAFFQTYSKHSLAELDEFYDMYGFKEYDKYGIKRVARLNTMQKQYLVELYKKFDADIYTPYDYIWNIEMLLMTNEIEEDTGDYENMEFVRAERTFQGCRG